MSITINGEPISEVSSFKYLGARFNSEAICDEEIKTSSGSRTYGEAAGYLSKHVSYRHWYGP